MQVNAERRKYVKKVCRALSPEWHSQSADFEQSRMKGAMKVF
jgi:hypothetical protein